MTEDNPTRHQKVESASIRALSSITSEQAEIIKQAVRAAGAGWNVQTTDDYDGYLSILIAPGVSDDKQASYFVAGTAQRLQLFKTFDDNMTSLANFSDVESLSAVMLDLIARH